MSKRHHVACDLDGTLASFDGWRGIEHIGPPVPSVLAKVKWLLENGHQVSIYTSRVAGDWPEHIKDLELTRRHIERWCHEHVGRILPITAVKHGWFTEFWDDKAMGIQGNEGLATTSNGAAYAAANRRVPAVVLTSFNGEAYFESLGAPNNAPFNGQDYYKSQGASVEPEPKTLATVAAALMKKYPGLHPDYDVPSDPYR